MLSLKKNPSLKNIFVKSKMDADDILAGTFNCNRKRCITCNYTNRETTIQGPSGHYTITTASTCTTSNVVYAITCLSCSKIYVGETKRRLADRFLEHRRDIINKKYSSPVAQHFNGQGHSIEDLSVSVLVQCSTDANRKLAEMRAIYTLGTQDPAGMNIDFSFNV